MSAKNSFYTAFEHVEQKDRYHEKHNPHTPFLSVCTVFSAPRNTIEIDQILPPVLPRYKDHVYADDIVDARVPGAKAAAHKKMGLDEERGGVVVVRPDGYVGAVVKLVEGNGTAEALNKFFSVVCGKKFGGERASL